VHDLANSWLAPAKPLLLEAEEQAGGALAKLSHSLADTPAQLLHALARCEDRARTAAARSHREEVSEAFRSGRAARCWLRFTYVTRLVVWSRKTEQMAVVGKEWLHP
jgi:hypothetical protein